MPEVPAIIQLREELAPMRNEFGSVLPSHISPEKFMQVCITAIENNAELLNADRHSFKVACLNAANDGLLPDKREGAFVIFNTKVKMKRPNSHATYEETVAMVQWMPMIRGIVKKAHQSGLVQDMSAEMVYEHDEYSRAAGDDAKIVHIPLDFGDRGKFKGAYAIVRMKDGGVYREVMSEKQIGAVRAISKTGGNDSSPWNKFFEEMVKKTVIRRLLKIVPLNAEVDQVLARDDVFYNLEQERRTAIGGPASDVTTKTLFGNKPVRKPKDEQVDPPAPDDGLPVRDDTAEAAPEETGPTQGDDVADAEFEDGVAEAMGATEPPFVLQAMITTKNGVRPFENVDFWYGDISQKMAALKTKPVELHAFWKVNLPFIQAAGLNGFGPQAMKLITKATEMGLMQGSAGE